MLKMRDGSLAKQTFDDLLYISDSDRYVQHPEASRSSSETNVDQAVDATARNTGGREPQSPRNAGRSQQIREMSVAANPVPYQKRTFEESEDSDSSHSGTSKKIKVGVKVKINAKGKGRATTAPPRNRMAAARTPEHASRDEDPSQAENQAENEDGN
jgi:hypothetical protein